MKFNKKYLLIIILSLLVAVATTFLLIYSNGKKEKKINHIVKITLNEPNEQIIEVNGEYEELGASLLVDDIDKTSELKIDTSDLKLDVIGEYKVKYYTIIEEVEFSEYRLVKVKDTKQPVINLKGKDIVILVGEEYEDPGYEAIDNYDGNLTEKVKITNNINNKEPGDYEVIYKVLDSSNNEATIKRKVTVKVPKQEILVVDEGKPNVQRIEETKYSNTITKNKFTNSGIYFEGYVKNVTEGIKMYLKGDSEYEFNLNLNDHKYSVNIDINGIENGNYKLYIGDETLQNKIAFIEKLSRAHVGNKLVTFNYSNNEVNINISDFYYQYDILIDPGHGGSDPGASNKYIEEKEMNLKVSLYEKCRYESHGLSVYMTRTGDTRCHLIAPTNESLRELDQRGYEVGYYGAVSKIVYSNHHNSINNTYYSGYELLIPAALPSSELQVELSIVNAFNSIYTINETHKRFYTRDYDSETLYSKINGEVYSFRDYYALNRIPLETANVKSIVYEGAYLSNKDDFNWYWTNGNWKRVSEAKIKAYVNSLGVGYIEDASACE